LKDSGHFCISDVVLKGDLPQGIKEAVVMYAGCVSGAVQKEEYLKIIADQGFTDIQIKKEKQIKISDDVLSEFLSAQELKDFKDSGTGIYSITVTANR
jgi:hypothetical protein